MKTVIIYDSYFSNTEKIAKAIYNSLKDDKGEIHILNVKDFKPKILDNTTLLIIGSPTRAFRPTEAVVNMIKEIPNGSLNCTNVVAFDTRIDLEKIDSKILAFFVKLFGYAAPVIQKELIKKGGISITEPMGFFVEDKEGPLTKGEEERAKKWTEEITKNF
jgi:flavodoxin